MTQEEALEIIANAKPIVLPKSGTTVSIKDNQKIMNFKDLFKKNGNSRREESKASHQESGETEGC